jgi:hypothetical protein
LVSVEADEGSKAMEVDYLPDEMEANTYRLGCSASEADAFDAGWRAACEAMQARAQAKGEPERVRPRYWAATVDRERPRYWRWNDNGTAEWIYPHRTEPSRYDLAWWDDMPPDLYIACTTEAEARKVAGFPDAEVQP